MNKINLLLTIAFPMPLEQWSNQYCSKTSIIDSHDDFLGG